MSDDTILNNDVAGINMSQPNQSEQHEAAAPAEQLSFDVQAWQRARQRARLQNREAREYGFDDERQSRREAQQDVLTKIKEAQELVNIIHKGMTHTGGPIPIQHFSSDADQITARIVRRTIEVHLGFAQPETLEWPFNVVILGESNWWIRFLDLAIEELVKACDHLCNHEEMSSQDRASKIEELLQQALTILNRIDTPRSQKGKQLLAQSTQEIGL